jgi:hypothetical protein
MNAFKFALMAGSLYGIYLLTTGQRTEDAMSVPVTDSTPPPKQDKTRRRHSSNRTARMAGNPVVYNRLEQSTGDEQPPVTSGSIEQSNVDYSESTHSRAAADYDPEDAVTWHPNMNEEQEADWANLNKEQKRQVRLERQYDREQRRHARSGLYIEP